MMSDSAEVATTAPSAGAENNATSNSSESNTNNPARRRNNRRNVNVDLVNKSFEGETPDIGAVLALKSEKVDKKLTFDSFREKLSDFLMKKLDHAKDVVAIVKTMKDPSPAFHTKHKPTDMSSAKKESATEVSIHQQKIKLYVTRTQKLEDNIHKVYAYI